MILKVILVFFLMIIIVNLYVAFILMGGKKYIATFDENKKEMKNLIESLDDLYKYEEQLVTVIKFYDN